MPARDLFDAVYGCLAGGAAGDALGAPVEGWYFADIRARFGKVREMAAFDAGYAKGGPGTVTDDTVYRHYLCWAVAEKGGRITPDDLGRVWLEKVNPARLWLNERITHDRLRIGMSPWDSGRGAPPCGCASMAAAAVGVINAGDPTQAFQDGFCIGFVNQDDVNRDAAGTVAAGVAAAFLPGATVETVIGAMREHSTFQMRRALDRTLALADEAGGDVDAFAERFYETMLDWTWPQRGWRPEKNFSGNSLEFVPVVAALLRLTGGEPERAIVEGASFGRDCDTMASLCGNVVGALCGASALRRDWVEAVESANAPFFEELTGDPAKGFRWMAGRLVDALRAEREKAARRADLLGGMLG